MPYRLEFTLPGLPKTTNSKRRMAHWAQLAREASQWKRTLTLYLLDKKPPKPLQKAKLTLLRASSQEPDFDGLISSFKHVVDGLVAGGILINDKPSNIGQPIYQWKYAPPGHGFIKVTVEEVIER